MAYPYEEEDKRAALTQGLLAAGLAALGARKGSEYNAFAQAGLLGLGGYQNSLRGATEARDKVSERKMREQEWTLKMKSLEDAQAAQQALGKAYAGMPVDAPVAGVSPRTAAQFGPEGGDSTGMTPMPPAPVKQSSPYDQLLQRAQYFQQQAQANPQYAPQLMAQADKYMSAAKDWRDKNVGALQQVRGANGQPMMVQGREYGSPAETSYQPAPKWEYKDSGGSLFPVDMSGAVPLSPIAKSVDPNTQYTGDITKRGQNMTDARSRESTAATLVGKTAEATSALRKEFQGLDEVKNYKAVVPMLESAKNAPDTPAGDLDLIYAVGKVLDPGSVVREGELNLVIKSGTPLEQFQGYARAIGMGKGRLPPAQRKKLIAMLDGRVGELGKAYQRTRSAYEQQAAAMGLPADQVFADVAASGGWSAQEIK